MGDVSGASHLEFDNPTHCQVKSFASATAVFTRDNRCGHRSLDNMLAAPFGNTVEIPEVEFRGEVKMEPGGRGHTTCQQHPVHLKHGSRDQHVPV